MGQNRFWSWQKYHVFCCFREVTTTKFWILRSHKKTWQKVDYFNSWQFLYHSLSFAQLHFKRSSLLLFSKNTLWILACSCFWNKKERNAYVFLNSRSSKSFGKSPENYFYWGPIGSIFKQIPIAIFRIILPKLKHVCKR